MEEEWILIPPYKNGGEPKEYPWPFSPFSKKIDEAIKSNGLDICYRDVDIDLMEGFYTLRRIYGSQESDKVIRYSKTLKDTFYFRGASSKALPVGDFTGYNKTCFIPYPTLLKHFKEEKFGEETIHIMNNAPKDFRDYLTNPEFADERYDKDSSIVNSYMDIKSEVTSLRRELDRDDPDSKDFEKRLITNLLYDEKTDVLARYSEEEVLSQIKEI